MTPTQEVIAWASCRAGIGPQDIATALGLTYTEVWDYLQSQGLEAGRRILDGASPDYTVPTPTITLTAGPYTGTQYTTITGIASGADVFYTVDGSTPTNQSTPYTGVIVVAISLTLKAIVIWNGVSSSVASATYVIS